MGAEGATASSVKEQQLGALNEALQGQGDNHHAANNDQEPAQMDGTADASTGNDQSEVHTRFIGSARH